MSKSDHEKATELLNDAVTTLRNGLAEAAKTAQEIAKELDRQK